MLQIRGGDKFLSVVKPLEANLHVGIPVALQRLCRMPPMGPGAARRNQCNLTLACRRGF
jgi:hypothetical protein